MLSIEHDPIWYEKTKAQLKENLLKEIFDYCLLTLVDNDSGHSRQYAKRISYTDAVTDYSNGSLDFAFMDGKMRYFCVQRVLPELRLS